MSARAALVAVLLSTVALAQTVDAPTAPPNANLVPWRNVGVSALEGVAMNFSLLAFNNVVTHMDFAKLTGASLLHNLEPSAWTLDVDYYLTNQFGHPYQGALTFNAARSAGLSFWWSTLYAALGSLTWELFFEAEPPSVNDQITTTMGGALLGEALHRAALQLRATGGPRWLTALGAALLDPLGALNGLLLEEPSEQDITLDALTVRWRFGVTAGVLVDRQTTIALRDRAQALVTVLVVSGPPWDPRSTYDAPLSYFDVRADLSFPRKVVGNIFIRGLLSGRRFERGSVKGVWGVFGEYDYAAPTIVRASAVGVGPGVILELRVAPQLSLHLGAVLAASPFAAAGQLLDVSPDLDRDYHVGPGLQTLTDLRLVRPHWFELGLVVHNWLVVGAYTAPAGFESITWVSLAANVPVWRWLGVGAEAALTDRRAHFAGDGDAHDTGLSVQLTLNVMNDPLFGIQQ